MQISVQFKIDEGTHVRFWTDDWLQGPIYNRYAELYEQTSFKEMTVAREKEGVEEQNQLEE